MGWTSAPTWNSSADIKAEILGNLTSFTVLATASTCYAKHLWFALAYKNDPSKRFVLLVLVQSGHDGWSYKDIAESMGPAEVDCPLRLLDLTEPGDGSKHATEWRAKVRAVHAEQQRRNAHEWTEGDLVHVDGCRAECYRLDRPYKRGSWVGYDAETGAGPYKLPVARMSLYAEWKAATEAKLAELRAAPYLGTSAFGSWHERVPKGFVGLYIAPGGFGGTGLGMTRAILVPLERYDARQGSYVVVGDEPPWCGAHGEFAVPEATDTAQPPEARA